MNPAVGVTKILNNLQECVEIIDKINKSNAMILPVIDDINYFIDLKKKIVEVLNTADLSRIEKMLNIKELTGDILIEKDGFISLINEYTHHHNEAIEQFNDILLSVNLRIRKLTGNERIAWFKGWKKTQNQFDIFKGIVTSYSNWEYPSMEIFPGIGDMLPHALGAEPLYIVDWDNTLLDEVSKQFNEFYANKRLMKYKINDFDLSELPQNSFGFVYCLNYLFFENIEGLVDLAKNVYKCLMPGGTYLFAYNNSDDWWSVKNAVENSFGLVNSKDLNNALTDIGFEIIQNAKTQNLNFYSYVICKKPGEIEYIKDSSILAKIIDKPKDLM